MGLVKRRGNQHRGARARNIGTGVAGLLADYPVPTLLLTDVLLNLNRVLIAIHIALLLRNPTHVPRSSGGLW